MHGLTGHPEPAGDLDDRHPVIQDFQNCLIALLHDTELHQHRRHPPIENLDREAQPVEQPASPNYRDRRRPGTGATVAQVPEPRRKMSHDYRSRNVKHLPGPHRTSRVRIHRAYMAAGTEEPVPTDRL